MADLRWFFEDTDIPKLAADESVASFQKRVKAWENKTGKRYSVPGDRFGKSDSARAATSIPLGTKLETKRTQDYSDPNKLLDRAEQQADPRGYAIRNAPGYKEALKEEAQENALLKTVNTDWSDVLRNSRLETARVNQASGGGEGGDKKEGSNVTQSITKEIAEIPKAPDFTNAEKFALKNQASGKNSVALTRAKLKQWQFDQNQQRSVTGLKDQPTNTINTTKPTNTTADPVEHDYNPGDAIPGDERAGWKPGVMHEWNTDMDIDAKAQPVSGGMSAGGAMAINAGVKLLQAGLADKDKKIAQQNEAALATARLGGSTDREEELDGWLKKPSWMSWVA